MDLVQNAIIELREKQSPFFDIEEIGYYIYEKHEGNFDNAMYEMCMLKAEDDSISLPGGLQLANNREYWLSLAKKYKPSKVVLL